MVIDDLGDSNVGDHGSIDSYPVWQVRDRVMISNEDKSVGTPEMQRDLTAAVGMKAV